MGEILRTWLRTRLGIIIDLTPEIFGHYARDGTLMAKLLHSYDIISSSQLNTIKGTQDPALCRVNLKHLRLWLQFIGVDCDNDYIQDISNGRGTTALRLFYKIFLSLENKDSLHFITLQKEREKYVPTSSKFDVNVISDENVEKDAVDHPLAETLLKNADSIEWHRSKYQSIIDACKVERQKYAKLKEVNETAICPPISGGPLIPKAVLEKRHSKKEIDEFSRRHNTSDKVNTYKDLCEEKKQAETLNPVMTNGEAARTYLKRLKSREKQTAVTHDLKSRMRDRLVTEMWDNVAREQENKLDREIARMVLTECRYEKQMITKLCEIREQRGRIARNRQIVEDLVQKTKESRDRLEQNSVREVIVREAEEFDAECNRMCELHQRLRDEKIRAIREKHFRLCNKAVDDIVDMSVKMAEYRLCTKRSVPTTLWNEWQTLFVEGQPILDLLDRPELIVNTDSGQGANEVFQAEIVRQEVLNTADILNYVKGSAPPWDQVVSVDDVYNEKSLKLGETVLGYIVHKLLRYLYPKPSDPQPLSMPNISVAAIVLGVLDSTLYPALQELLKNHKIRLVRVEDAINYCLRCYKESLSINSVSQQNLDNIGSHVTARSSRTDVEVKTAENYVTSNMADKRTQTPRIIPYDDFEPDVRKAAYYGKWANDYLTLGEPITNELSTKMLVEYLKSLTEAKGWALINFPMTYDQMALLEFLLTGRKVPQIIEEANDVNGNIEEVDPVPSRITFEDESEDEFALKRNSKLLPNPLPRQVDIHLKTFMTTYIKAESNLKHGNVEDNEIFEILPEDSTPVDTFYTNEGIAYILYYSALNLSTLKKLARLILGNKSVSEKSSVELFGDALDILVDRKEDQGGRSYFAKQILPRFSDSVDGGESGDIYDEALASIQDFDKSPAEPGEDHWEWIDFPQPPELLEAMATLWENMENVYIQDLKDVFFIKRIHYAAIAPYQSEVTKHMTDYIKRPDNKQNILHEFHKAYNAVEMDVRDDPDVMDTMELLHDYYMSMLQRPINEYRLPKVVLHRYTSTSEMDSGKKKESKETRETKTKTSIGKDSAPSAISVNQVKNEIANILIDCEKNNLDLDRVSCYEIIRANFRYVQRTVESVSSAMLDSLKKEEMAANALSATTTRRDSRSRGHSKRTSTSLAHSDPIMVNVTKRSPDLFKEWRSAMMYEVNRVKTKLKILEMVSRDDIGNLLKTMQSVFGDIYKMLVDRYKNEVQSVDQMATVFCYAIEQSIPLQNEMLLDGDKFIVRLNVLLFPDKEELSAMTTPERISRLQFGIIQLGRLLCILRYTAPNGSLMERHFVYLIQDMIACQEDCTSSPLPLSWFEMEPNDVENLIFEIFGNTEYIDWREFIIYAMDIPIPTHEEILYARDSFRKMDSELREVVTRDQFYSVPLWFLESTNIPRDSRFLLHDEMEQDEEEMYEEELFFNTSSAMSTFNKQETARKSVIDWSTRSKGHLTVKDRLESNRLFCDDPDDPKPETINRYILAKKLLCQMYLTNAYTTNYTAFLLAFCKSDDPRDGFGKALTLAMGGRVCIDEVEGESYVSHLLEQRRLQALEDARRNRLREEAVKVTEDIVMATLDEVVRFCEMKGLKDQIQEDEYLEFFRGPLIIESLDEPGTTDTSPAVDILKQLELSSDNSSTEKDIDSFRMTDSLLFTSSTLTANLISTDKLDGRHVLHWVPRETCQAVLLASLPWHARQPNLYEVTGSLQESLKQVYLNLYDKELNEEKDVALAHRLVNHPFIAKMLSSTSKFTTKNMARVLDKLLQERDERKNASKITLTR
ncbi:sperm flagellar protein 2 isoform X2 [Cephus cinctus]|uniref:Sperm flagellar protein 2 isoform X2 n=1 Tax=Cephus cinctus TaxID=211228 RepID=A0AAJ7BXT9_CEPCN|nr:sperm flagellar protein 2 isoform X2 [Cephus cinctus]